MTLQRHNHLFYRGAFSGLPNALVGAAALAAAGTIGLLIHWISERGGSVADSAVALSLLFLIPMIAYGLLCRRRARPDKLGLLILVSAAVLLAAVYFYCVSSAVAFRGDFLIWSEGDFVNDVTKLRLGYPLYSAPENIDSFFYPPAAQYLTYSLASLMGAPLSIPVYRSLQVGYAIAAALLAASCCQMLYKLASEQKEDRDERWWWALWVPVLMLAATNQIANPFIHNLHNDSLGQLVSVLGFWLLVKYVGSRRVGWLVPMAMLPAVGFMVKQSLLIWGPLYFAYLLFFDSQRNFRRLVGFGAVSVVCCFATLSMCYLAWGEPFIYWVLVVLRKHAVSPLRSFDHALDAWTYFAIGCLGGMALLRGPVVKQLLGLWFVWFCFLGIETYTSGIAWMRNHMGPGTLIAAIWAFAGLRIVWPKLLAGNAGRAENWLRSPLTVVAVGMCFSGMGLVHIPQPWIPPDSHRYLAEIESEVAGEPMESVLIDFGCWLYARADTVRADGASVIGELGYCQTGHFADFRERIRKKKYTKILVRQYHQTNFTYDHHLFPESSGIRDLLAKHYREVRSIDAVDKSQYLLDDISVLVPK